MHLSFFRINRLSGCVCTYEIETLIPMQLKICMITAISLLYYFYYQWNPLHLYYKTNKNEVNVEWTPLLLHLNEVQFSRNTSINTCFTNYK